MSDLVIQSQVASVCKLTLNRPATLNSFNQDLHQALLAALNQAAADPTIRCVILTGQGRAFSAGQDLNDPQIGKQADGSYADLGAIVKNAYHPLVMRITSMPIPVIAAVNGIAAGAGASIALACDIVLAARSAVFIQAFNKIGLLPDSGGTWLLPRLVGRARALGLTWFGDKITAQQAEQWGLIWQMVEDAALLDIASEIGQRLAAMPLKALVATRFAMDKAQYLDLDTAILEEAKWQQELGQAGDYREGVKAFMEKRTPVFSDR